jgi:hypothetical protein
VINAPEFRIGFSFVNPVDLGDIFNHWDEMTEFFQLFDSLVAMLQLQFNYESEDCPLDEDDDEGDDVYWSCPSDRDIHIVISSLLMSTIDDQQLVMEIATEGMDEILRKLEATPVEVQMTFPTLVH